MLAEASPRTEQEHEARAARQRHAQPALASSALDATGLKDHRASCVPVAGEARGAHERDSIRFGGMLRLLAILESIVPPRPRIACSHRPLWPRD